MGQLSKRLAAIGGIIIGILTLRFIRNRRARSEPEESSEQIHEEAETASEHASAAVDHARMAKEKMAESRKKQT